MPLLGDEQFALAVRAPVLEVVVLGTYALAYPDLLKDRLALRRLATLIVSERYPLPEGD